MTSNSEDLHIVNEDATETASAEQRVADLNWRSTFVDLTCRSRQWRPWDVRAERARAQCACRHKPRTSQVPSSAHTWTMLPAQLGFPRVPEHVWH